MYVVDTRIDEWNNRRKVDSFASNFVLFKVVKSTSYFLQLKWQVVLKYHISCLLLIELAST